jgi:hypothetical protein
LLRSQNAARARVTLSLAVENALGDELGRSVDLARDAVVRERH